MKVSLAGIDAPQISRTKKNPDQPYSRRAKTYLTELVLNQLVEIKGYGLDKNDHVLGVIFLEGKNINIEMIRAGLARVSSEKLPKDLALHLRAAYSAVQPGYHMNKKHWNTIILDGSIPNDELLAIINDSYDLVVKGLKKSDKLKLGGMDQQ